MEKFVVKGVIFNVLEDLVVETAGMNVWNDILNTCHSDGVYTSAESYPDEELFLLVGEICKALKLDSATVIATFGEFLFHQLDQRHPDFVNNCSDLPSFLKSVDSVIHNEVHKLYDNPHLPRFHYANISSNSMTLLYTSPRKLCILAEGLIRGAAKRYNSSVSIKHPVCMHHGAEHCELHLSFE